MAAFSDTTPSSLADLNRLFGDAYILLIREMSKPRVKNCVEILKQVRHTHTHNAHSFFNHMADKISLSRKTEVAVNF